MGVYQQPGRRSEWLFLHLVTRPPGSVVHLLLAICLSFRFELPNGKVLLSPLSLVSFSD